MRVWVGPGGGDAGWQEGLSWAWKGEKLESLLYPGGGAWSRTCYGQVTLRLG